MRCDWSWGCVNSHVRVQHALHAVCMDGAAQKLPALRLSHLQRDRPTLPNVQMGAMAPRTGQRTDSTHLCGICRAMRLKKEAMVEPGKHKERPRGGQEDWERWKSKDEARCKTGVSPGWPLRWKVASQEKRKGEAATGKMTMHTRAHTLPA
eukprot:scaffold2848_cov352-Pavlova_lutheri.AAC.43